MHEVSTTDKQVAEAAPTLLERASFAWERKQQQCAEGDQLRFLELGRTLDKQIRRLILTRLGTDLDFADHWRPVAPGRLELEGFEFYAERRHNGSVLQWELLLARQCQVCERDCSILIRDLADLGRGATHPPRCSAHTTSLAALRARQEGA